MTAGCSGCIDSLLQCSARHVRMDSQLLRYFNEAVLASKPAPTRLFCAPTSNHMGLTRTYCTSSPLSLELGGTGIRDVLFYSAGVSLRQNMGPLHNTNTCRLNGIQLKYHYRNNRFANSPKK